MRATSRKAVKKYIVVISAILAIGVLAILANVFFTNRLNKVVTMEAGTKVPPVSQFIKDKNTQGAFVTDLSKVSTNVPGVYEVKIKLGSRIYQSALKVEDTVAPKAEAVEKDIPLGEEIAADEFAANITDATEVKASYINKPDFTVPGVQDVSILLEDAAKNRTQLSAKLYIGNVQESVNIEIGSKELDVSKFMLSGAKGTFAADNPSIDLNKVGEYDVGIVVDGKEYTSHLQIVDTTAPRAEPADQEIWANDKPDAGIFVKNIKDSSAVKAYYREQPDFTKAGVQNVKVVLEDSSGNKSEYSAKANVKNDTEPPAILGAHDQTVYIGNTVSYKKDVSVKDNRDASVKLEVDSSTVNLKKEGSYEVIYKAADSSGNTTVKTVTFKVMPMPKDYINKDTVDEMADKILASITKSNMTELEKAHAIYNWVRSHIDYINHSDKSDWIKGAYQGIKTGKGDCFVFYSTAQELLTRAGIRNEGIIKIDAHHYWNLVDLGNGWYHFDTTPRKGGGTFFMLTDSQIEAYSRTHKNSHVWDKTKYPATSTKEIYDVNGRAKG